MKRGQAVNSRPLTGSKCATAQKEKNRLQSFASVGIVVKIRTEAGGRRGQGAVVTEKEEIGLALGK